MKKIISTSGLGALLIAILMSSCVSKKKYVQAQQTIEKYRMDSAQMAQNATGLQQNIASLEEKNRGIQAQLDSSKAATQAEIQRWSGLQGYYDEEKTSISNIHQQLHDALASSDVISADEITASNGRVYVTLDDQVFSGGQLSTKGKKAIADFADVLKDKQDLVVDVASGNSYAAYWSNTTAMAMDSSGGAVSSNPADVNNKSDNQTSVTEKSEVAPAPTANANASSRPTARTSTAHKSTAHHSSAANRSQRATASKSSTSKSTAKRSESGRKMNFKTKSKSDNSWNSNMSKATAIAKELHKNGIYNVGLMVPGSSTTTTSDATGTGKRNFQLIVSPKSTRYYQMLESNSASGTTSGR